MGVAADFARLSFIQGLLLAPHDGEILIPVAHSSLGYAFLFNLPSLGQLEYNSSTSYWRAEAVKQADMWVSTTADSAPHAVRCESYAMRFIICDANHHGGVLNDLFDLLPLRVP